MAKKRRRQPIKEDLKDLFAMHRGERRAFAMLTTLCLIGAAWVTWEQWIRPARLDNADELEVEWAGLVEGQGDVQARVVDDIELFHFDPNGLPIELWMRLGLSEKQAEALHRYEAKGGRFRTKRDLARMRTVRPELFELWEPYIQLPDSLPARERAQYARKTWPRDTAKERREYSPTPARRALVEVNTADSVALVAVNGIGPAFARSILRYRERLGGFHSIEQLAEVPILRNKPDAVQQLKDRLVVDHQMVRRIDLNTCTVEELAKHPYMDWKVAKALVAYRGHHGPFKNVADIAGCILVTDSIRLRISPYLAVAE